ncbi:fatty-acid-binding protein 3, chloroplastic [Cucurbita moschata]|uniref:Chalcone-flavonone isomerase family protein n=1 Tax=Cucurbita moschata TaxID=3662 RepID=A0A6J1FD29_CUCMO|nr:fatty-acid-binding protein 3, chloroplastic [Cucurbita moschata]
MRHEIRKWASELHESPLLSNPTQSFQRAEEEISTMAVNATPLRLPPAIPTGKWSSNARVCLPRKPPTQSTSSFNKSFRSCSNSANISGFREKVFAIIGVKVYAAGLYINSSISNELNAWRGRSAAAIQEDSSLFNIIFQSPSEKSLQIVLVRDVDGKTFWDALDDAISPRIKAPTPVDESALSTFRSIFEGRSLKKGTFIFLTWLEPPKMLVSISVDGPPTGIEATIESNNVTSALFDVFFGDNPVSPTLKASVAAGLSAVLK